MAQGAEGVMGRRPGWGSGAAPRGGVGRLEVGDDVYVLFHAGHGGMHAAMRRSR